MASKPKQVRLSLEQKGVVLKKSDGGIRANRLAIEFGVSESAISQIKSKRKEILNALSNSYEEVKKKKRCPKQINLKWKNRFTTGFWFSEKEIAP